MSRHLHASLALTLALLGALPHARAESTEFFGDDPWWQEALHWVFPWTAPPEVPGSLPLDGRHWSVAYDGHGLVEAQGDSLLLEPRAPGDPRDTHAALALLSETLHAPLRDFQLLVRFRLERPLRKAKPNPWETLWVFFNYRLGRNGLKETNYFILKPGGAELGFAWNELDQEFYRTDSFRGARFGEERELILEKRGDRFRAFLDRKLVMRHSWKDDELPRVDAPGAVGLYVEDARVRILRVAMAP